VLRQTLVEQLNQRESVYQRAHFVIDVDGLAPEEVAASVEHSMTIGERP